MMKWLFAVVLAVALAGCAHGPQVADSIPHEVKSARQPEEDLNERQRKVLDDWTFRIKTGNSVADVDRLKDSLKRWDELFTNPAPPDLKPVFVILKERVKERIAELEAQSRSN